MSDKTQVPFRARCGNQGLVCQDGPAFQQYIASYKYDDYTPSTSPTPVGIAGGYDPGSCDDGSCSSLIASYYSGGTIPSGAKWKSAFFAWSGAITTPELGELWNDGTPVDFLATSSNIQTFTKGGTVDLGKCHNFAHKEYAAIQYWPGVYGFTSEDNNGTASRAVSPDQTRYRTITFAVSDYSNVTNFDEDVGGDFGHFQNLTESDITPFSGYRSVNKDSGEITNTVSVEQFDYNWNNDVDPPVKFGVQYTNGGIGWTARPGEIAYYEPNYKVASAIDTDLACFPASNSSGIVDIPAVSTAIDFINSMSASVDTPPTPMVKPSTPAGFVLSGSYSNTTEGYSPPDFPTASYSITVTRTNTLYTWDIEYDVANFTESGFYEYKYKYVGSMTLSDAYSITDMMADGVTSLNEWQLNGPEPWRFDSLNSIMPLVEKRGKRYNETPVGFNIAWSDDLHVPENDANHNAPFCPGLPSWPSETVVALGLTIVDANNNVQQVTTAGTTNNVTYPGPPSWATTPVGATTTDNDVVWTLVQIGLSSPTLYGNGAAIVDTAGNAPNSPAWLATLAANTNNPHFTVGESLAWIPTYQQTAWFDPACYKWTFPGGTTFPGGIPSAAASGSRTLFLDGAIIGKPHPDGQGATGWFDSYVSDERFCRCRSEDCTPPATCGSDFPQYTWAKGGTLADFDISFSSDTEIDGRPMWQGSASPTIPFDSFLPKNSTHWVNCSMAHEIANGGMIDIGGITFLNDTVALVSNNIRNNAPFFAVKRAFARLPVPSMNFARPCGQDRIAIDEPSAQCVVTEVAGVTLTLATALPSTTGQTVLVFGTAGSDGIWTGCTQALAVLTLGTKISSLPTDYYHPFCGLGGDGSTNYFAAGFAGIVRFPNCPALCGRQQFTMKAIGDPSSGTTQITFSAAQTNLRTADPLDFEQADMSALATPQTNIAVTRLTGGSYITDKDFSIPVPFNSMAGAVYATSHGAAAWYWDDASQKMQFRWNSWNDQNRPVAWSAGLTVIAGQVVTDSNNNYQTAGGAGTTGGSAPAWPTTNGGTVGDNGITWTTSLRAGACTQSCQEFSPCLPQVFAATPNNDTDPSWEKQWFSSFTADGVFGSRAILNAEWEMADPFWQVPKQPDDIGGGSPLNYKAIEDDGTGTADYLDTTTTPNTQVMFYPPHPRVEGLCQPPDGTGGNGAGASRNEAAPMVGTPIVDALGQSVDILPMVQPVSPGVVNVSYNLTVDPGTRYANEIAAGSGSRFAKWYYALTLGGGK